VRNITADDVGVQGQRDSNVSRTVSEDSPEGPPDGSPSILAIVAILGASLALSLVSCVLFYIVGQRTASGLPDTHQKKVSVSLLSFDEWLPIADLLLLLGSDVNMSVLQ